MAHHTAHRRNLAASDPKTSMDPTNKKHPKATPFNTTTTTSNTTKAHPTQEDPTIAPSSIQNISNHFSKLYTNHKLVASLKASKGYPQPPIDTHLEAKSMAISTITDSSSTSLIKSNRQGRRSIVVEMGKQSTRTSASKVKETDKNSLKESHDIKTELVSCKNDEVKRPSRSVLKLTNPESEVKEFHEEHEMKRPSFSVAMGGGRRSSFCCSPTEFADFFSCNGVKVVSVDMPPFMQIHAVNCARKTHDSLEKFTAKTLASSLKKEFDGVYGPAWHCIVGTSFGSFVTHSVGGFLYFSMDHKLYVLLFKTTVQRADN